MMIPFRSLNRRLFAIVCGLLVSLAGVGCGGSDGPRMVTVTGTASFDGTPIEDGRILFRMTGGDSKAYSGAITAGKFTLECESGPVSVEITAMKPIPGKFDTSNGDKVQMTKMYIPTKYNSATTLKKEVGTNATSFDFALTTK